jgi:hypothetical protein
MHTVNLKNGKREGTWAQIKPDGIVYKEYTGAYKDGKKISY